MLELCDITKKYKSVTALKHIFLTLSNGIYGLLGPNGAGKSTMMNLITGNLRPDGGHIRWNGTDIRALGAYYRSILGYAPQQQGLYDTFTGRRFLSYMAALKGISRKELPGELARVLAYVNLEQAADRPMGTYSGGMKQRILIAQAIMGSPRLVVLDEPTAGLDPKERVRIRERIRELAGDKIILVSTHVVSDIEPVASQILLLKSGHLVDQGTVADLIARHEGAENLEDVYMRVYGDNDESTENNKSAENDESTKNDKSAENDESAEKSMGKNTGKNF